MSSRTCKQARVFAGILGSLKKGPGRGGDLFGESFDGVGLLRTALSLCDMHNANEKRVVGLQERSSDWDPALACAVTSRDDVQTVCGGLGRVHVGALRRSGSVSSLIVILWRSFVRLRRQRGLAQPKLPSSEKARIRSR